MPQCNFSNKISLPKLPGFQLPGPELSAAKHSGAGLQRSGASRRPAEGARGALPAATQRPQAQGAQASQASGLPLEAWASAVPTFLPKGSGQQGFSLVFPICLCSLPLSFKNDFAKALK